MALGLRVELTARLDYNRGEEESVPRLNAISVKPFSKNKAWLLGFLAGDGAFDLTCTSRVTAHLGDPELVEHVMNVFRECYEGSNPIPKEEPPDPRYHRESPYWKVRVNQRLVGDDLLTYAPFGVRKWRVPRVILDGSDEIKGMWLRGFFDADGTAVGKNAHLKSSRKKKNNRSRYASASSVNLPGMDQVSELLHSLKIPHRRHFDKASTSYSVRINYHQDLRRFMDIVGYESKRKTAVIEQALASLTKFPMRQSTIAALTPEILRLRREGSTCREVATALKLSKFTVYDVCRRHGVEPEPGAGKGRTNCAKGERGKLYPEIMRLRAEKVPGPEIARRLGLKSRRSVTDIIKYWKKKQGAPSSEEAPR